MQRFADKVAHGQLVHVHVGHVEHDLVAGKGRLQRLIVVGRVDRFDLTALARRHQAHAVAHLDRARLELARERYGRRLCALVHVGDAEAQRLVDAALGAVQAVDRVDECGARLDRARPCGRVAERGGQSGHALLVVPCGELGRRGLAREILADEAAARYELERVLLEAHLLDQERAQLSNYVVEAIL